MDPDGDNILIKEENSFDSEAGSKASGSEEPPKKKAKKQSRFNGISEEELSKRLLPDLIQPDLDILIVSSIVWNFCYWKTSNSSRLLVLNYFCIHLE